MHLVSKTSLAVTKTVIQNHLIGSNGLNLSIENFSSEIVVKSDIFYRSDLVDPEQVTIIESHWIVEVSINLVLVHRY